MAGSLDNQGTSTRPYLVRALHDWCTDNGFTPYVAVHVGPGVQVPMEYVKNNEIVLNVGFEATSSMSLGNETIEFKARFGGVSREICVPIDHVVAIYARENGQGMAFPKASPQAQGADDEADPESDDLRAQEDASAEPAQSHLSSVPATATPDAHKPGQEQATKPSTTGRPTLTRIK